MGKFSKLHNIRTMTHYLTLKIYKTILIDIARWPRYFVDRDNLMLASKSFLALWY